ncbi:MAG: hypothetical protein ACYC63_20620 [Armatimonadota bacterium]
MRHHKDLRTLCLQSKEAIFASHGEALPCREGNLRFTDNGSQILGVCHVDTVEHKPRYREQKGRAFSTALDDRLGIYILTKLLPARGIVLDWLLTDNEECGGSTASDFVAPKDYRWTVEFDREGSDVVLYQYDDGNLDEAFAAIGVPIGCGSYSDICDLPNIGTTCFNFGVGYHRQHSPACYVDFEEMAAQVDAFARFYEVHKEERLEYDADACDLYYYGEHDWSYYERDGDDASDDRDTRLRALWLDYSDPVAYADPELGPVRLSETEALEERLLSGDAAPRLTARERLILDNYLQW